MSLNEGSLAEKNGKTVDDDDDDDDGQTQYSAVISVTTSPQL